MWPRFAGTTKRKCEILEFEECIDTPCTSRPKRRSTDSPGWRKRKVAPVIVEGKENSPKSTFATRSFFSFAKSPSALSSNNRSFNVLSNDEEATVSSDTSAVFNEKTPINKNFNTFGWRKRYNGNRTTGNITQRDEVKIEVDESTIDIKSEPNSPAKEKDESYDEIIIEASERASPQKYRSIEATIYEVDSVADSCPLPEVKPPSFQSSSSSSTSRYAFFGQRRLVEAPPSPKRHKKRKLCGLPSKIASHLASCRADRLFQKRDPHVKTMDVRIEKTVRCWGVSISKLSPNQQQLFCRRPNATVPASGPASFRLALPLPQVQIYSHKPPALLHPVFVQSMV